MYGMRHNKVSTQRACERIRVRASQANGNGRPRQTGTGVRAIYKRASTETGTDRTVAIGNCRECWRIPANGTYVRIISNESAYKGVK